MIRSVLSRSGTLVVAAAGALALVVVPAAPAAAGSDESDPPGNLRVEELEPESMTVAWDGVSGASEYRVAMIPLDPVDGYRRMSTDDASVTLGSLTADSRYKVTVRAVIRDGWWNRYTDRSEITAATPLPGDYEQPGAPRNLRVERDADGEVDVIRWDAPAGETGTQRYRLHLEFPDFPFLTGVWERTHEQSVEARFLPISGGILGPGQSVTIWVTTSDELRNGSPPSNLVTLVCCPL